MPDRPDGPWCQTEGCDETSVGIHRHVGPSEFNHAFGTTTGWEEACAEHFGTVLVGGVNYRANRTYRYPKEVAR